MAVWTRRCLSASSPPCETKSSRSAGLRVLALRASRTALNLTLAAALLFAAISVPSAPSANSLLSPAVAHAADDATKVDDELVYIDPDGVIRTMDFSHGGTSQLDVEWFSPVGGYLTATLIDVQGDGDMEIAALRNTPDAKTLDIYDPVISSGAFDPDQTINGIPWTQLYTMTLPNTPILIDAGNLDAAFAGDEIFFTIDEATPFFLRQVGARDGRNWEVVRINIPDRDWDRVALGDMDVNGLDEVALVQSTSSVLGIWRMVGGGNTDKLYEVASENRKWQWPAMGEWRGDGRQLLGMVRLADYPYNTFIIYRYSYANREIVDDYGETFTPGPRFIMFGDVNGNGDDEAFMLRELPAGDTRDRLIGRNRGSDALALTGATLTTEEEFLHGAMGDVDGDGFDEVILLGKSKLRIYSNPAENQTFIEEDISTNRRTLLAGDLDAAGYLQELVLTATPATVRSSTPAGGDASAQEFDVTNGTTSVALPFQAVIEGSAPWMSISVSAARTPATVTVAFDSTRLDPGAYTATILLTSSNPLVLDQPVKVPVILTVTSGLLIRPRGLAFVSGQCAASPQPKTRQTKLIAASGTTINVTVVNVSASTSTPDAAGIASTSVVTWPTSVDWITATSPSQSAPTTLNVTVDFTRLPSDFAEARAIVVGTEGGLAYVRTMPIYALCTDKSVYLPFAFD